MGDAHGIDHGLFHGAHATVSLDTSNHTISLIVVSESVDGSIYSGKRFLLLSSSCIRICTSEERVIVLEAGL